MLKTKKVKLDAQLYMRAREAASIAGYATTRELVEHAVEKLLEETGKHRQEDKQAVEERLRGLGYIA